MHSKICIHISSVSLYASKPIRFWILHSGHIRDIFDNVLQPKLLACLSICIDLVTQSTKLFFQSLPWSCSVHGQNQKGCNPINMILFSPSYDYSAYLIHSRVRFSAYYNPSVLKHTNLSLYYEYYALSASPCNPAFCIVSFLSLFSCCVFHLLHKNSIINAD